jgi:hypothetical protein
MRRAPQPQANGSSVPQGEPDIRISQRGEFNPCLNYVQLFKTLHIIAAKKIRG